MKTSFILFVAVILLSCNSQDCETLPKSFKSYNNAVNTVEHASFNYKDGVNTSKSSWIRDADYYSCDNTVGFLIIETDSRSYIYQNVPISIWKEFKQASSFGRYYNSRIKGKYRLSLNN